MNKRFAQLLALFLALLRGADAFVTFHGKCPRTSPIFASTSSENGLQDIAAMRVGEIKNELESYGISTKAFLEKSELVDALQKARDDGLKPKAAGAPSSKEKQSTSASSTSNSRETSTSVSRDERLQEEIKNCQAMRAGELKKELKERGDSTVALLEKSELVQALAEARVDGKERKTDDEENYAEYADVEVVTDGSEPQKRSSQQKEQPQSSNPFGGMGGMGSMGGMADMLKNMGGMGGGASPFGGGANPFGGSGNPFGAGADVMGQAQKMMKNPKVMELMAKAQSNPKMMSILNECMSNPSAVQKYENDPELRELISELKNFM